MEGRRAGRLGGPVTGRPGRERPPIPGAEGRPAEEGGRGDGVPGAPQDGGGPGRGSVRVRRDARSWRAAFRRRRTARPLQRIDAD